MDGMVDPLHAQLFSAASAWNGVIYVADDDPAFAAALCRDLAHLGVKATAVHTGRNLLRRIREERPNALIVSVNLPKVPGIEICRCIRRTEEICGLPIILVGETNAPIKARGTIGADDYLLKPFDAVRLVSRLRHLFRIEPERRNSESRSAADLTVDLESRRVVRGERAIHLGPTDFRLLHFFIQHAGEVLPGDRILKAIWAHNPKATRRTLIEKVSRLRHVLNHGNEPDLIKTLEGPSYAFMPSLGQGLGAGNGMPTTRDAGDEGPVPEDVQSRSTASSKDETLRIGDLALNLASRRVTRADRLVPLSSTQFRLLRYFLERTGETLSPDELLRDVWTRNVALTPNALRQRIYRLRGALNEGGLPPILLSRDGGYALMALHSEPS